MPRRKFQMVISRNVQTTPYVQFRQRKMGPNPGSNPNPLIGWRKQLDCSRDCSCNSWQEVFKNNCCQPAIKRIQNKNGIIDASYNYTTQGYLQKRCLTYNQNAFNFDISGDVLQPFCCGNNCHPPHQRPKIATYKKSNPQFRKQGAVSSRARLNRLKYNTIVSSLPRGEIYWGGQTANKNIMRCKTKNKCFCAPGILAPCRGQNLKCEIKN